MPSLQFPQRPELNRNRSSDRAGGAFVSPTPYQWSEHFVFAGARIEGISATGRATVQVLTMNDARRLEVRREVLKYGALT
jgi:hypothetical protein